MTIPPPINIAYNSVAKNITTILNYRNDKFLIKFEKALSKYQLYYYTWNNSLEVIAESDKLLPLLTELYVYISGKKNKGSKFFILTIFRDENEIRVGWNYETHVPKQIFRLITKTYEPNKDKQL